MKPLEGTLQINSTCPNGGEVPPGKEPVQSLQAMTTTTNDQVVNIRLITVRACTCKAGAHMVVVDLPCSG